MPQASLWRAAPTGNHDMAVDGAVERAHPNVGTVSAADSA
jgi:hypothetical protein